MFIAIIEDSAVASILVEKVIQKIETVDDVKKFTNGADFVKWCENDRVNNIPDLIITDINMPLLDGIGVIKYTNSNPYLEKTDIIVISANQDRSLITECLRMGADNYIIKPFDPKKLKIKLEQYLLKEKTTESKIKHLLTSLIKEEFEHKYNNLKYADDYYQYKKLENNLLKRLQESLELENLLRTLKKDNKFGME